MKKIKIITDSTVDLPIDIINKYEIQVLPLIINLEDKSYFDGVDININELLDYMKKSDVFPTTAQVIPQRFLDCYKEYLDAGYKIVSIHMSSKMSGTYQSACIARDMLESNEIVVIDSQNVTSGLGLLVMKACRLRDSGCSIHEIEAEIKNAIPHVKSALAFESLDNLVKGGRLSKTAGVVGNILGIKLILTVENGEMAVRDKVRGNKKAIRAVIDYLNKVGIKEGEPTILLDVEGKEVREALKEELISRKDEFIECEVGCGVGVHAGYGACGIFFIEPY